MEMLGGRWKGNTRRKNERKEKWKEKEGIEMCRGKRGKQMVFKSTEKKRKGEKEVK